MLGDMIQELGKDMGMRNRDVIVQRIDGCDVHRP